MTNTADCIHLEVDIRTVESLKEASARLLFCWITSVTVQHHNKILINPLSEV